MPRVAPNETHRQGAGTPAYPRRLFLGAAGLAVGALAGCSTDGDRATASTSAPDAAAPPPAAPQPTARGRTATQAVHGGGAAAKPGILATSGPDIVHGPRARQEVALTFHGQGPADLTRGVLDECDRVGAVVTVFAVGTWLAGDPALGRAVVEAGHELGNHTWSHQQMRQLDATAADREVARGAQALRAAVGTPGWWFRPSGTQRSTARIRSAAVRAGYNRCVSYDVDPEDYLDPGAQLVRTRTRRAVRGGSVVSLHLGHAGTVEALPGILADLSSMGLHPVSLSTLLRD
jgi:peptidoglycan/xylan/chitin deacetylase (PgdA/CDA1 family)